MPSAKPAITVRFEHSEYLRVVEAAEKVQRTPANYVAVAVRRMLEGVAPQVSAPIAGPSEEVGVIGTWVGGRRGTPGSYLKQASHPFEEGGGYGDYDPNEEMANWLAKGVSRHVAVLMAQEDCPTSGVYAWTPLPDDGPSDAYRADLDFEWRLRLGATYPEAKQAVDAECARRSITGWDPPSIETEWMERGKEWIRDHS